MKIKNKISREIIIGTISGLLVALIIGIAKFAWSVLVNNINLDTILKKVGEFLDNKENINSIFIGVSALLGASLNILIHSNLKKIKLRKQEMNITQISNGSGDNIGGNKIINSQSKENKLRIILSVLAILISIGGLYIDYKNNKKQEMNITQISNGSGDNIGGNKIINNFKTPDRELTEDFKIKLESYLLQKGNKKTPIQVFSFTGDLEARRFADKIQAYLIQNGWNINSYVGDFTWTVEGVKIAPALEGEGLSIQVGTNG